MIRFLPVMAAPGERLASCGCEMRKLISRQHHPGPLSRSKIPTNVAVTPLGLLGPHSESVPIKMKVGREAWKPSMNEFDIFDVRDVVSQARTRVLSRTPGQQKKTQERGSRLARHRRLAVQK